MKKHYYQLGYGGTGMFLWAVLVGFIMYFYFYPESFPKQDLSDSNVNQFCRPYTEDDGSIKSNAPTIMAPSYTYDVSEKFPVPNQDLKPYRLIKANVYIDDGHITNYYSPNELRSVSQNELRCPDLTTNQSHHSHFCQWVHPPITLGTKKYAVLYPAPYSESIFNGYSSPYNSTEGNDQKILFVDYQILFLVHLENNLSPETVVNATRTGRNDAVDVYQRVDESDPAKPIKALPSSALHCLDNTSVQSSFQIEDVKRLSPYKAEEQLGYFLFNRFSGEEGWYYPACKPAIYLYPKREEQVNVQVKIPHGFLTYTDPLYQKDKGWSVVASPNGDLRYLGSTFEDSNGKIHYPTGVFPYLYYEGKVSDAVVKKPEQGYVRSYDELPAFFDQLLPQLGLNSNESKEFKDYWLKVLPKASYYFIGVIPQEQLNANEPLTITPKEDTMIRVRLYFEAMQGLSLPEQGEPLLSEIPQRTGFTVVDWGGMVKTDKAHPFTCLQ